MIHTTAAIILAGSHSWNADSLEALCPRTLLPVANAPLISYALEWLRAARITEVAICANDANFAIQSYVKSGTQRKLEVYYYEDRIPRGPAGCVRDAAYAVPAEQYIVTDGSIIPTADLTALRNAHHASGAAVTVVASVNRSEFESGNGGSRPVGIYAFHRRALDYVPATGYQDIKEALIPRLHHDNEAVHVFLIDRAAPRILDLPTYFAAQAWLLERVQKSELAIEGYEYTDGVFLHQTARLAQRARIVGPVMVGPHSRVEDDALIVGPSVLGRNCIVGRRAVLEQAVLWDSVTIGEGAIIDRCLISNGVAIQAGSMKRGVVCSYDTQAVAVQGMSGFATFASPRDSAIMKG